MTHGRSRSGLWLAVLAVLMIAGAAFLGWRLAGVADGEARQAAARRPPDIQLTRLGGGTLGLGDLLGEVVVVDFWASWCGPCRLQAKILAPLHEELGDRVQFLAVNLGEDLATVERYVEENAFPYPVLMDPAETLGVDLAIYALPTVMVLDRAGHIAYLEPGISDAPALRRALSAAGALGPGERAAG